MANAPILEVFQKPATSAVIGILIAVWLFLSKRQVTYSEVGLSYERALKHKEYWRLITAQLSHIELLHLVFNCYSLWSLGSLESNGWRTGSYGSIQYLGRSLLLVVLSGFATLGIYHIAITYLNREHFQHVTVVGYSAVVFGWMTVHAISTGGKYSVWGILNVPMALTPVGSLVLTSLIIRRASFVGHLAGILSGALMATGCFDWLGFWWSLSLLAWTGVATAWSLTQTGHWQLTPLRQQLPDIETGILADESFPLLALPPASFQAALATASSPR